MSEVGEVQKQVPQKGSRLESLWQKTKIVVIPFLMALVAACEGRDKSSRAPDVQGQEPVSAAASISISPEEIRVDLSQVGIGGGQERAASFNVIENERIVTVLVEPGDNLFDIKNEDFQGYNTVEIALIPAQIDSNHPIERFRGRVIKSEEEENVSVDGREAVDFVGEWNLGANLIRPGDVVIAGPRDEFRENWRQLSDWREGKPIRTYEYW